MGNGLSGVERHPILIVGRFSSRWNFIQLASITAFETLRCFPNQLILCHSRFQLICNCSSKFSIDHISKTICQQFLQMAFFLISKWRQPNCTPCDSQRRKSCQYQLQDNQERTLTLLNHLSLLFSFLYQQSLSCLRCQRNAIKNAASSLNRVLILVLIPALQCLNVSFILVGEVPGPTVESRGPGVIYSSVVISTEVELCRRLESIDLPSSLHAHRELAVGTWI